MITKKIFAFEEAVFLLRQKFDIPKDYVAEVQVLSNGKDANSLTPCVVFVKNQSWEELEKEVENNVIKS